MTKHELADDVRRFILTSIPSVPFLEAVLLLRADPQLAWDAPQLARRLYVSERSGAELVALLRSSGIAGDAGEGGAVHYAAQPALAALIDGVAEAYAAELVTVTGLIHSRIDRRAQQFADAFRFRKE